MRIDKKKTGWDIVINVIIAVMVFVSWIYMIKSRNSNVLSVNGIQSLKYFTVLSNLTMGVVSLISVVFFARCLITGKAFPKVLFFARYTVIGALFVTFVVATAFLMPLYGATILFGGANLSFHLLIPIFSILDFVLMEKFYPIKVKHALVCSFPTLIYGVFYLINILVNGNGWENDFYGFTLFGYGVGVIIFIFIVALNFALNCITRILNVNIKFNSVI